MKESLEIHSIVEFEEQLRSAMGSQDVAVFKYSPYCTISFVADNVMKLWFKRLEEDTGIKILKINVISSRPLSNEIAEKFGIRHESPQLIWLDQSGGVKWHGSHHRITEEVLTRNLNS